MFKNRNIGIVLVKAFIIIAAWIYVGYKLYDYRDSLHSIQTISFSSFQIFELLAVLFLMFINWSIEAKKWQYAIQSIIKISFKQAFKNIMTGATIAIISPNRAGEPIGRVSQIDPQFRESATSASIYCSLGQFTSTLIGGCFAFPFFINKKLYFTNTLSAFGISIIGLLFILILYLNISKIVYLFKKISFIKKYDSFISHFQSTSKKYLITILLFSLFRYSIFLIQFYLILLVFDIDISFVNSSIAVGMIYFVTTLIPTTTLAELGVRCSSSVYFIGVYTNKPIVIITASMFLWFINVSLPAIIGSLIFIPKRKKN